MLGREMVQKMNPVIRSYLRYLKKAKCIYVDCEKNLEKSKEGKYRLEAVKNANQTLRRLDRKYASLFEE